MTCVTLTPSSFRSVVSRVSLLMSKILSSLFLGFFLSPFLVWICLQVFAWVIRKNNAVKRQNVLQDLNVSANEHRRLVGFFHPYWWVKCISDHIFCFNMPRKIAMLGVGAKEYFGVPLRFCKQRNHKLSVLFTVEI